MPEIRKSMGQVLIYEDKGKPATGRLVFSPALADRLGLVEGESVSLCVGQVRQQGVVHVDAKVSAQSLEMAMAPQVLKRLGLGAPACLHLVQGSSGLRLGPVVGILAPRRAGLTKPYQAQTSLFKRVIAAGDELGIMVYVFDFHDIRWSDRKVRGYTFAKERWVRRVYPLPDVVFDRATGVFPGGSLRADKARQRLVRGYGIKLFNTRLGGKMRMHKLMQADPVLRQHLPTTRRVTGSGVVTQMMGGHGGAYLKPQNGAQGKGIIRLRRAGKGISYTLTTDNYSRVRGQAASVAGALSQLRRRVALSNYIVQPDLNLLRINGRVCDVRVLVQKDADGAWHVTGVAVRAGAPGSVVSNLHGGGRSMRLEGVLQRALGADESIVDQLREQIERLALRIAEVLSRSTSCLGELGVDLGVDKKGKIWIIEANSRTGRAVFRRCGKKEAARLADRRPLLFAMYLAGFTTETNGAGL